MRASNSAKVGCWEPARSCENDIPILESDDVDSFCLHQDCMCSLVDIVADVEGRCLICSGIFSSNIIFLVYRSVDSRG